MESLLDTVVFGCSIVLNLSSDQDRASSESDLYGGGIGDVPELRASPCPRLLLSSVLFFTSSSLLLPSSLRRLALDLAQASVKNPLFTSGTIWGAEEEWKDRGTWKKRGKMSVFPSLGSGMESLLKEIQILCPQEIQASGYSPSHPIP